MTNYFGFGIADSMFPAECSITRTAVTDRNAAEMLNWTTSVLNPSHTATIQALQRRLPGVHIDIPAKAPVVTLAVGDKLLILGVSGLPRLEGRHEYTDEEVAGAAFRFGLYTVTA